MTTQKKEITVTVETEVDRGVGQAPWKISLASEVSSATGGEPSSEEVVGSTKTLQGLLDSIVRECSGASDTPPKVTEPPGSERISPRSFDVLREVYTPRSLAHVDDLLWEKQITPAEHDILVASLGLAKPAAASRTVPSGPSSAPVRTVDDLIREFDLRDLRDVNRARGKELISFEEWSLLKKHFTRS